MTIDGHRYYFHAGKGGVGKSTTSSLAALHLARTGKKIMLVSLDPAHNQCDIFDRDLGPKPREMAPNLLVAQADVDHWMSEYLRGIEEQMRRTYTYQTAFNLEKHLGIIKHSPGIEEYALLLAFRHYSKLGRDCDAIFYDMPPTALATKFFNLPSLSLLWVRQLQKLRKEILDKKQIITKVQFGKKEIESDKVSCRLDEQHNFYSELEALFKDGESCVIHVVVNPDKLSFAEAERVDRQLEEMGIHLNALIMNKVAPESTWDESGTMFRKYKVHPLPLSPTPLIGVEALSAYLDAKDASLAFLTGN